LVGIFAVAKGPSGSADPFGLRRAAIGILSILEAHGWHVSLSSVIDEAMRLLEDKMTKDAGRVRADVSAFLRARLKAHMTQAGQPTDAVEAVLSAGFDDALDVEARGRALSSLQVEPEFEPVATTFKRVGNILKGQSEFRTVDPGRFEHESERALHEANAKVSARVEAALEDRDFQMVFRELAALRPQVDRFFDEVMVMAEDRNVRDNRIALLAETQAIFAPIADLSRLSG